MSRNKKNINNLLTWQIVNNNLKNNISDGPRCEPIQTCQLNWCQIFFVYIRLLL